MQWIVFLLGHFMLAFTAAAGEAGSNGYASDTAYTSDYCRHGKVPEHFFLSLGEVRDLYDIANQLNLQHESSGPKMVSKRALSVLSRWRPFGNFGMRINSIHKNPSRGSMKISMSPGTDFVSAETRDSARPMGQPLRWGRKR